MKKSTIHALFNGMCGEPSCSTFTSAPAFNPITDSPVTIGQPGYIGSREKAPRSPHKRVLPQTPKTRQEPGIWAVSPPDEKAPQSITVEGIEFKLLPVEKASELGNAFVCRDAVQYSFWQSEHLRRRLESMSREERMCAVMKTWRQCMNSFNEPKSQLVSDYVEEKYKLACKGKEPSLGFLEEAGKGIQYYYFYILGRRSQ